MLNLDTHILIHALAGELTPREQALLRQDSHWGVSAIVLWEIFKLYQIGRVQIDLESPEFRRLMAAVHVWPLDAHVCRQLPRLDFRPDPADEMIAATSLAHAVPLVTRDSRILRSRVVPLALRGRRSRS